MRFVAALALVLWLAGAHAEQRPADFETGMRALQRGDYAVAYQHWLSLAEMGYAEAQYHLGWLYANGNGLAVDVAKAVSWWGQAAEQGRADAQFAIGLAYTTGEGLKKDLETAIGWYLAAARLGHLDARDIVLRLNGEPDLDLLTSHPDLADEDWFGWRGRVTRDRINVRQGPGTRHEVVTRLDRDTELRVVGRQGDWWMVVLPATDPQKLAWIYKGLLRRVDR